MPGRSGILLIQQIRASHPALPILVLSMYRESQYAVQAIRAGAAGYLTKNVESDQLLGAIRKVRAAVPRSRRRLPTSSSASAAAGCHVAACTPDGA